MEKKLLGVSSLIVFLCLLFSVEAVSANVAPVELTTSPEFIAMLAFIILLFCVVGWWIINGYHKQKSKPQS
jgi:ABC-type uncharacterized transport system permease subunit